MYNKSIMPYLFVAVLSAAIGAYLARTGTGSRDTADGQSDSNVVDRSTAIRPKRVGWAPPAASVEEWPEDDADQTASGDETLTGNPPRHRHVTTDVPRKERHPSGRSDPRTDASRPRTGARPPEIRVGEGVSSPDLRRHRAGGWGTGAPETVPGSADDGPVLGATEPLPVAVTEGDIEEGPFELGGFLRGRVIDPDREPVPDVVVRLVSPVLTGPSAPGSAVTTRGGEFLLERLPLPPVNVRVTASARGWTSEPVVSQTRRDAGGAPWVTINLVRAGSLVVAVADMDGRAVVGAKVSVRPAAGTRVHGVAMTDDDGIAVFDDAPTGDLVVTAEKTGYSPPGFGASAESAKRVTVGVGRIAEVVLRLERTVALGGVVVDAEGVPVPDVGVFARVSSLSGFRTTGHTSPSAQTDGEGRFTLMELPEGRVQLCAVLTGRGLSSWVQIPDATDGAVREVVLQLLPSFRLEGIVVTAKHTPVVDAKVAYRPVDPAYALLPVWGASQPRRDGSFEYVGVPALDAVLTVTGETFDATQHTVRAADIAASKPVTVVVTTADESVCAGTVVDGQGNPIRGAVVRIHASSGLPVQQTLTDQAGAFALDVTGDGSWLLSAVAADLAPRVYTVTSESLTTKPVIVLDTGASVVLPIETDIPAEGIPGNAIVTVSFTMCSVPAAPFISTVTARLQPEFAIGLFRLCPGTYSCAVTCPDMSSRSFNVTVQDLGGRSQVLTTAILITREAVVSGTVVAVDGTPIPGAVVRVEGSALPRTTTGAGGLFALAAVPAGDVALRAESAESFGLTPVIRVNGGARVDIGRIVLDQVNETDRPLTTYRVTTGIGWRQDGASWEVGSVAAGTGAATAGLQRGDRLVSADGAPADGWSRERLLNAMAGDPGTWVDLVLARDGRIFTVRAERQIVPE